MAAWRAGAHVLHCELHDAAVGDDGRGTLRQLHEGRHQLRLRAQLRSDPRGAAVDERLRQRLWAEARGFCESLSLGEEARGEGGGGGGGESVDEGSVAEEAEEERHDVLAPATEASRGLREREMRTRKQSRELSACAACTRHSAHGVM